MSTEKGELLMKKLSKKDEQLVLVLIVLAIVLAIYYLMIIPFKNRLAEANIEKELARDEYEQLISANERPQVFQESLDRMLENIEKKEALIPEKIEKGELIEKAIMVKNMLPRGIKEYNVIGPEASGNAVKNKIIISFATSYAELESLINKIGTIQEKVEIDNIQFTIDNSLLIGSMDVYFYSKA